MHRFFIPPEWLQANRVIISGPLVHQIRNVLRLKPGDDIIVLDDSGWEYRAQLITVAQDQVVGQVQSKTLASGEPRTKITLYQGVLKGKKLEWVWQKGTELGVVEFVPVICRRCVINNLEDIGPAKFERWQRIILEAAEQSRRGRLPRLQPAMLFESACARAQQPGLSLMPWEEEKSTTLRQVLRGGEAEGWQPFSINLFIGPEGGLTGEEVTQATGYGIIPVTLGPRILRAETAGLVATTAILYELGDLQ